MPGFDDDKIMHVPLTNFTLHDGQTFQESLGLLTDRLSGYREGHVDPEEVFKHMLSELWLRVAKPVLDALAVATPSTTNLQRIWWCPTGPLAFLPIHAAGLYGEKELFGSKLSDFVISSYAPSLTALISGFQSRPASEPHQGFQLLAVAQPSADGQSHLPGTSKEIDQIQLHATGKLSILHLEGNMATVDSVQKGTRECGWVHFACHGIQDVSNPTESALLLAGSSRLTLSSIMKLSLPRADLAFLSACQTATGAKKLQEDHVYEHLFKASPPDPTQAAEALHLGVRKLREDSGGKKSFFHWVPYIHKESIKETDQKASPSQLWTQPRLQPAYSPYGLLPARQLSRAQAPPHPHRRRQKTTCGDVRLRHTKLMLGDRRTDSRRLWNERQPEAWRGQRQAEQEMRRRRRYSLAYRQSKSVSLETRELRGAQNNILSRAPKTGASFRYFAAHQDDSWHAEAGH
ncbi:CHAT domain-containing protein [Mycena olivaceomarginata]|nr:CHAT domain-containing protein [Mycena olivaceomarginata]